ncbi:hypothetical protein [Polymorphospora sp. NPDC050346]|uniref:hypothetical protein n=1 Tax=Polymorphospora sp. NPDC050346 TaxID=3155780 RepID=UPI0033ECB77C
MGIRRLVSRTRTALAVTVATVCAVLLLGAPAALAQTVRIDLNPPTVQAGNRVGITASCGDNLNQARVESDAFGQVILQPENGVLTGAVTVPGSKAPGNYNVHLTCANGSTADTNLNVINQTRPTQGPAAGGGGMAGGLDGRTVLIGGLATLALGAGLALATARRRRGGARA